MSFGGLAVVSTTDRWFNQFHLQDLSLMIQTHHFGVDRFFFFRYKLILTNGIFHGIYKKSVKYINRILITFITIISQCSVQMCNICCVKFRLEMMLYFF